MVAWIPAAVDIDAVGANEQPLPRRSALDVIDLSSEIAGGIPPAPASRYLGNTTDALV